MSNKLPKFVDNSHISCYHLNMKYTLCVEVEVEMEYKNLAKEYLQSAHRIKERIDQLKRLQKTKKYEEQRKLEDRIVILTAEYTHLIKTANYLFHYYDEEIPKRDRIALAI